MGRLTNTEIRAADLADWRKLAQALHARYTIPDFPAGAAFVAAVAEAAEAAGHHPDLTLSYGVVGVRLATHEEGSWVTPKDIGLARTISRLAIEHGLTPDPAAVLQVELGLDTAGNDRLAPFWSAVLTGGPDAVVHGEVLEPSGQAPSIWFQDAEASQDSKEPRQRWHLDVWVAPEAAEGRIDAALAAGGVLVDDRQAPSFVVLADPDGNKACICTALDRR
jgi:4a-hydroxytetrahydrobiopterin dehydratase